MPVAKDDVEIAERADTVAEEKHPATASRDERLVDVAKRSYEVGYKAGLADREAGVELFEFDAEMLEKGYADAVRESKEDAGEIAIEAVPVVP